MKKSTLIVSTVAAICAIALITPACTSNNTSNVKAAADSTIAPGSIVFFNLDTVLQDYDMANDLRSVVETKVNSINQEVTRRGNKLEKDIQAFQDKMNKGLLTQSTYEVQSQKLAQQQQEFEAYANQKQNEILEEQNVMMNQIADAIKTFVDSYNEGKGYAMIIATQGAILPAPVVTGDPALDITDDILEGLNAEYVKSKGQTE